MWEQNFKQGFGVFTFHDGAQYIGRFHNDKMIDYNAFGYLGGDQKLNSNERLTSTTKGAKLKLAPLNRGKPNGKDNMIAENNSKNKENENTEKINKERFGEKEPISNVNNNGGPVNRESTLKDTPNKENSNSNNNNPNNVNNHGNTYSKIGFKGKTDLKNNLSPVGLEAISEQAELINLSMMGNEKKEKENNNSISYNNLDSAQVLNNINQSKQVISNRILKESEYNIFKTLIDLSDIIECEPEIESSLKEVENILLRHLSEMKVWYRYYTYKESQKDDVNSINASGFNTQQDEKEKTNIKDIIEKKSSKALYLIGNSNNNNNNNQIITNPSNYECIYNNDLGFAMEMKDLWRFLRDSNVICSEFSLAQFNRLFFKGRKNYIEMFMCPDDIDIKIIYDYIYVMIINSRDEFYERYRDKLISNKLVVNVFNNVIGKINPSDQIIHSSLKDVIDNSPNDSQINKVIDHTDIIAPNKNDNNKKNTNANKNLNLNSNNILSNKNESDKSIIETNFDIHNKKQTILIRQFYEAIVRAAYLRFFHVGQSLGTKLTILIDTCIKNNIFFKKSSRKSNREQQIDNSVNSSIFIDKKIKNIDTNYEFFLKNFEKNLKIIFRKYYSKFSQNPRFDDMTFTFRFFYNCYITKSQLFNNIFNEKLKFIEIINVYHKDKIPIGDNTKITKELFNYVENLFDIEIIFFEFCEVIFFISKKYFAKHGIMDTKENYCDIIKDLEENLNNYENFGVKKKYEKAAYFFPKLKQHTDYENLIAHKLAREEEERKRKKELKRIEYERKMMEIEDMNILPDVNEEEEMEDEYSMDSF